MPKIRVLIADDAVVIRRLLSDCLVADPDIEVVGTAADGQIALAKIEQVNPDLVTMDIEMPVMDGLKTLVAIRKTHPRLPVIMFSTLTDRGASATLDALALGASDYVTKPANVGSVGAAMQRIRDELIPKIKGLCHRGPAPPALGPPRGGSAARKLLEAAPAALAPAEILAIGVSTGGPNALSVLLPGLSRNFPAPIVIVQHMPPLFTRFLAERLQTGTKLTVEEAVEGTAVKQGRVLIAPGDYHMRVRHDGGGDAVIKLDQSPPENSCRPAVDVLFRSVGEVYGGSAVSAILTGMGQDGLRGAEVLRARGAYVIAQDEATSVVWGMPGSVVAAGLANCVVPLDAVIPEVLRQIRGA